MKNTLLFASLLLAMPLLASRMPALPKLTPDEQAGERYNSGTQLLDKASKLEQEIAAAPPERQAKLQAKVRGTFEKAVKDFQQATKLNPKMYQAQTHLGYALRKLGNYPEALAAYDRALAIVPNLGPALEYRAEAYLGLNRLEDAKQTYVLLFSGDRALAGELATAMKKWVEARRAEPGAVAAETIDAFDQWLAQRRQVASQTSDLVTPKRSW